jgi:fatty acid desaturase
MVLLDALVCFVVLLWMQSTYVGHDSGHYEVVSSRRYNKVRTNYM